MGIRSVTVTYAALATVDNMRIAAEARGSQPFRVCQPVVRRSCSSGRSWFVHESEDLIHSRRPAGGSFTPSSPSTGRATSRASSILFRAICDWIRIIIVRANLSPGGSRHGRKTRFNEFFHFVPGGRRDRPTQRPQHKGRGSIDRSPRSMPPAPAAQCPVIR